MPIQCVKSSSLSETLDIWLAAVVGEQFLTAECLGDTVLCQVSHASVVAGPSSEWLNVPESNLWVQAWLLSGLGWERAGVWLFMSSLIFLYFGPFPALCLLTSNSVVLGLSLFNLRLSPVAGRWVEGILVSVAPYVDFPSIPQFRTSLPTLGRTSSTSQSFLDPVGPFTLSANSGPHQSLCCVALPLFSLLSGSGLCSGIIRDRPWACYFPCLLQKDGFCTH